jgi:hypothetical protein
MGKSREKGTRLTRRPARMRKVRSTILIVTEGFQTEPNYFNGLKNEKAVQDAFVVKVTHGKNSAPRDVIAKSEKLESEAQSREEDFDEVWCVLDAEYPANHALVRAARSDAAGKGFCVCISNPAFEAWFLAHFERTARPFADGKAVVRALDEYWRSQFGPAYEKNARDTYERLRGMTAAAIDNAAWAREEHERNGYVDVLDANSSTDVHQLVKHLLPE